MLNKTLSLLVTTSSQPGLMLRSRDFLDTRCQRMLNKLLLLSLMKLLSQPPLTGELKEPWTQSKPKVDAVHVGLFQLLLSLKAIIKSRLANSSIFQNNNLSIAIRLHMDVMVVRKTPLSHILNQSLKISKMHTFILVKMEYAKILHTLDKLKLPTSLKFKLTQLINLKPPSLLVLLPLQLKLIMTSSYTTRQES